MCLITKDSAKDCIRCHWFAQQDKRRSVRFLIFILCNENSCPKLLLKGREFILQLNASLLVLQLDVDVERVR